MNLLVGNFLKERFRAFMGLVCPLIACHMRTSPLQSTAGGRWSPGDQVARRGGVKVVTQIRNS